MSSNFSGLIISCLIRSFELKVSKMHFAALKFIEHYVYLFAGDSMFCGDRPVPEDSAICQESWSHTRLYLLVEKHHEDESRTGPTVCSDVGPG